MNPFIKKWAEQATNNQIPQYSVNKKRTPPVKPEINENTEYDLVYILKPSEKNIDLRYSLRSVERFCNYRQIWFVGYKPTWSTNIKYIPTLQNQDKWKNSIINYRAACNCPQVSDNFILMNDDFFAISEIKDWKDDLNVCLGTLQDTIKKYAEKEKRSRWQEAFTYAEELLKELNCNTIYDYETHLPIIINKKNFLRMLRMPELIEFQRTDKILHKRSIYKNLYPDENMPEPRIIEDVKITLKHDLSSKWLKQNWISVFDNVTGNNKDFPKFNSFLTKLFPNKSKYEIR